MLAMNPFQRSRFLFLLLVTVLTLVPTSSALPEDHVHTENYGGRSMLVYVPLHPTPQGSRAMVIVLHGGMGNAQRIESGRSEHGLNLDAVAEKNEFIVAYLNGTPATRILGDDKLGWNAGGGCCGQPAENNVDDVAYIKGAVDFLVAKYGIDRTCVFGIGHSNGAMMTQRLLCETSLYAAGIAISGPLNLPTATCPAARGKRVLAIHGEDDENVPVVGGRGTKGISRAVYNSEAHSRQVFTSSGATYELHMVKGADHQLDHIGAAIQKADGHTIAEEATRFFGLAK
jgi:polyhydroxybutyrate depolymerase